MYKFLLIILAVILPYSLSIHPFEVPDENAHYASLNFLYNEGRMPTRLDKDNLSLEEYQVEQIFGIVEHENRYSYHPDFRIEQVEGRVGKYESLIGGLNTRENRMTYSGHQSALYPPLYYWLTLPFFTLVQNLDILSRLFMSRLSSVIFTVLTIYIAYLLGLEIFKSKKYALSIAFMTLFFPMTTYIGSGVNSDNLHNLWFAVSTLLAVKLIYQGWSRNLSLHIGTVIGLDLLTKPQAYILLPIFAFAVIVRWQWREWRTILSSSLYILFPVFCIAGWQEIPKLLGGNPYIANVVLYGTRDHFLSFVRGYIHTHLAEMPVWYWGVFKWFGVVLPRHIWWLGTRLLGLAAIGLLIRFYRDIKAKKISKESRFIIFSLGANLIYALALFWFDWQFYQQIGRSLGLQARYYMPLLISQMIILLMGLTSLGWNDKSREWIRRGLILFFLTLQLASLYTQLSSYYDLTSIRVLFDQISQYKPFYAKGAWWYLWFPLYFTGIIASACLALKGESKK